MNARAMRYARVREGLGDMPVHRRLPDGPAPVLTRCWRPANVDRRDQSNGKTSKSAVSDKLIELGGTIQPIITPSAAIIGDRTIASVPTASHSR